ncbi:MAG: TIGR04013 family B12-binding domain/radical SAM domain-containing protein [Planctomycetota bacterium]
MASPLTVVWVYRRTGKFAFHALGGALASDDRTRSVPQVYAMGVDAVVEAVDAARACGHVVVVGWSFYSPDAERMFADLRAVRARVDDGGVLHVAGGVHATAEPAATLGAGFDVVGLGEGEASVCALVAALQNGAAPHLAARAVDGFAWLEGGTVHQRRRAPRVALDDYPPFAPTYGRYGPIEITRGCVYACRFCQTPHFAGAAFRHRSVGNVRAWVRFLVGRGFRDFRFLTPTALSYGARGREPDLSAVEDLLAAVRAEIGARRLYFGTFPCEVRPEHVTPAALSLLRRYVDNDTLILGGQSGSDAVLARNRRGHDAAVVERAVALCRDAGFVPHVDYLFGLPGEDDEAAVATLRQMERLVAMGARVHGHTFMPLPGTPLRAAAPGVLAPSIARRMQTLSSRGQAYGQWQRQALVARRLARADGAEGAVTAGT